MEYGIEEGQVSGVFFSLGFLRCIFLCCSLLREVEKWLFEQRFGL